MGPGSARSGEEGFGGEGVRRVRWRWMRIEERVMKRMGKMMPRVRPVILAGVY